MLLFTLGLAVPATAFEVIGTLAEDIWTEPIEVVVWVHDDVTPENEAAILDGIREGLDMWEDIPTSELAFDIVEVVRSPVDPGSLPHQLQIDVANAADLTTGGATGPDGAGNPGHWLGCVADGSMDVPRVTAHEVGHAIGFGHSTISVAFDEADRGVMHWSIESEGFPSADDVAAASTLYPRQALLRATRGTVTGRVLSQEHLPVSGVNVVAVNSDGAGVVGRLSGGWDAADGAFRLPYLPPGEYDIHLLDSHSFRGSVPSVNGTFGNGVQADNLTSTPIHATVTAGHVTDLGDVCVQISSMRLSGMHSGPFTTTSTYDTPICGKLPTALVGVPYEVWVHVSGGHHGLELSAASVPPGLAANLAEDPRTTAVKIRGRTFVRIAGTPTQPGTWDLDVVLEDVAGNELQETLRLKVLRDLGGVTIGGDDGTCPPGPNPSDLAVEPRDCRR